MRTLCIIAHSPAVTQKLFDDLVRIFGEYLSVVPWCLDKDEAPSVENVDMYVASFPSVFDAAFQCLNRRFGRKETDKLFLAHRVLSPVYFSKLLRLQAGTEILIAGNSELACTVIQQGMHDFGVCHLKEVLHYPEKPLKQECNIKIAVVTGVNKVIPPWVETVIDLGAKELALTTYNNIIQRMNLPVALLDEISKQYTIPIFGVTKKYYEEHQKGTAVLECIEDAVFTIDLNGTVEAGNKAALSLAGIRNVGVHYHLRTIFPELELNFPLSKGFSLQDVISVSDGQFYILKIESVGDTRGAVVLARKVSRVQELDGIVRSNSKVRGNNARYTFEDIMTCSAEMQQTVNLAKRFAVTNATILLEGESGVGKELFAHAIHAASERAGKPFVAVNLAAIPENLVESELFGYVEGSFTGARKGGRRGLFEEAHQGTIFLDEIGDAPLPLQSKLLRVLEEHEIRKVGGMAGFPVDVRVVAATNRPLARMVQNASFRADLFYRLCACPLSIPPLRERKGDILYLAQFFAQKKGKKLHLRPEVQHFLVSYVWPGNIRELHNVLNYIFTLSESTGPCGLDCLPKYLFHDIDPKESFFPFGTERREPYIQGSPCVQEQAPLVEFIRFEQESQRHGDGERSVQLLLCLQECSKNQVHVGRRSLQEELRRRAQTLSEHTLRRCLRLLADYGLIVIGTTRQGTELTTLGERYLCWRTEKKDRG